jgi:hypothetical protein
LSWLLIVRFSIARIVFRRRLVEVLCRCCAFLMSRRDQLWSNTWTNHIKIRLFILKAELTLPVNIVGTLSMTMRNLITDPERSSTLMENHVCHLCTDIKNFFNGHLTLLTTNTTIKCTARSVANLLNS